MLIYFGGLTLRPQDVNALRRLSVEIFSRELIGSGATLGDILSAERPGLSSAIRYLVDAERKRRIGIAFAVWKGLPSRSKPETPSLEDLLRFDPVFAGPGPRQPDTPEEKVFRNAYMERLWKSLRSQETLTREAERLLKRGADPLTHLLVTLQSEQLDPQPTAKPKRKTRR